MPASDTRIVWHGDRVKGQIRSELSKRVQRAAMMVQSKTQKNISKPFRGAGSSRRYAAKGSKPRVGTPSSPGEFPRADLGRLRQSIFSKAESKLTWIVATTLDYGAWLEEGTTKMAARPFLKKTLGQMRNAIVRILTAPIRGTE